MEWMFRTYRPLRYLFRAPAYCDLLWMAFADTLEGILNDIVDVELRRLWDFLDQILAHGIAHYP